GFSKYAHSVPYLSKYSNLIGSIEYGLVQNYVICIDDLERKHDNLGVKEVMGLVDELARQKNCKVVLIFNKDSLSSPDEQEVYEKYREKVVDIELTMDPKANENI